MRNVESDAGVQNENDGDKAIEQHHQKLEYGGRLVRVEWSEWPGVGEST